MFESGVLRGLKKRCAVELCIRPKHLIQGLIPDNKTFSCASYFNSQGICQIIPRPIDISHLVMAPCVLGEHYDEASGGLDGVVVD
jgi:hypothetical protein